MEWKKETISRSELERRQKEYMNAAMNMMKRSHSSAVQLQPSAPAPVEENVSEPINVQAEPEETLEIKAAEAPEVTASAELNITAEVTVTADVTGEQQTEQAETDEDAHGEEEDCSDACEDEDADDCNTEGKFGVYTADELLNGDHESEDLKKAAEILEEMTRNTAYMKKLADSGNDDCDPDTTDFPEFTGCGEDGDCSFRGEEDSSDEQTDGCEACKNE